MYPLFIIKFLWKDLYYTIYISDYMYLLIIPPIPLIALHETLGEFFMYLYVQVIIKTIFRFANLVCWGNIFLTVGIPSDNQPNSLSFNSSVYAQKKNRLRLIQITSVLNLQQHWKCNTYFPINNHWKYLNLMSILRVISGATLFWSTCFNSILHWKSCSFVSQVI